MCSSSSYLGTSSMITQLSGQGASAEEGLKTFPFSIPNEHRLYSNHRCVDTACMHALKHRTGRHFNFPAVDEQHSPMESDKGIYYLLLLGQDSCSTGERQVRQLETLNISLSRCLSPCCLSQSAKYWPRGPFFSSSSSLVKGHLPLL